MKACNKCGETKPLDDFYTHSGTRDGRRNDCKVCNRRQVSERQKKNLSVRVQYIKEWRLKQLEINPEKVRSGERARRERYLAAHPEKPAEWRRKFAAERVRLRLMRRISKEQATIFSDDEFNILAMREMYDLARLRTAATGFVWHVDHMVPVKSRLVCGLHYWKNMIVMPGAANLAKNNRWWPQGPMMRTRKYALEI